MGNIFIVSQDRTKIVKLQDILLEKSKDEKEATIYVNGCNYATCEINKANRAFTKIVTMIDQCNPIIDLSKIID